MTLNAIREKYSATLIDIYDRGEAAAITEMIFRHFLEMSGSEFSFKRNEKISTDKITLLETALEKLCCHVPPQYITGEAWFYGLPFMVNEQVLIPRPETEELVQEALGFLKNSSGKKVLDIGTGSGCIPVSIKKNIPAAEITSVDISENALTVAKENSQRNNAEINFRQMDFLAEKNWSSLPAFDVIISNPPYIPAEEKSSLDKNVAMHEPHSALFVPQHDPLLFYKKIRLFADEHLTKEGKIFLEVHENFAKETAALFSGKNYIAEIKKDIHGKERIVIATRFP